jgi:20S proteasome subunit beta 4
MRLMDMRSTLDINPIYLPFSAKGKHGVYADVEFKRYYCLSILDKHHHPDIDFAQGMKILRMCTDELKRRLPIDFKGVIVKVITKEGIREEEYSDDHKVVCP